MTLPIAFSTLACPDWTWEEVLAHAADDGYQGLELRLLQGETNLLALPQFQPAEWPARRARLAARNLVICGLGSSVRFDYADPAELPAQHATGCRYIDLAQGIGAQFVRVFGDTLPPHDSEGRERVFLQVIDGLEQLGSYAAERNVLVLIETHGDFADSNVMRELMQRVSAPAVGVLWDTHHPWRFYGEDVAETFERLQPWVRHTHWKDSIAAPVAALDPIAAAAAQAAHGLMSGHRPAHYVLFGTGDFPAEQCLALLANAGYTGWYSLEWEKAWHPDLAPPEVALPQFPPALRAAAEAAARNKSVPFSGERPS